jgi:amino acid transporter
VSSGATSGDPSDEAPGGLRRELDAFDTTAIVVGAVVGVGIFFTPSRVAALAGSEGLALIAWAIGGLVALAGAFTLAELGAMYPKTGGQYTALRDAYGAGVAFVYVLCNSTAIQAGSIAVIALVCSQHLAVGIVGRELEPTYAAVAATLLVALLAGINAIGVRWGARVQNTTVVAKIAVLLAFAVFALVAPTTEPVVAATASRWELALLAAMVPVLFSFGGWQQVTWIGGEVRDAERILPRAILAGVLAIVAIYLLANWAFLELLGIERAAASQAIAADAAGVVFGEPGRRVLAIAVGVSAFGVLNTQLLTGPRLVLALALDGRFFRPFARVHSDAGTPVPAIVLLASVGIALLWAAGARGVDRLITGVVVVDAFFFALTGLSSLVLRWRMPHARRPIRAPLGPVLPVAFAIAELGVIAGAWVDPAVRPTLWVGLAWVLGAAILYAVRFRRRE